MFEDVSRVFIDGLHQLGLASDEAVELRCLTAFQLYRQELLQWNAHTNLTAITDPEEVLLKHFLDSLSLLQAYDQTTALRLLDIGTGAGFPGIPLKIVCPSWRVTLLEATGKKTAFLQHIIDTLHLEDITVIHGRAEEFAHKEDYRAAFDIVTARAVAALPVLLESCSPYCHPGGMLILPKKGDLSDELHQSQTIAHRVNLKFSADVPVTLPGINDGRRLLVWKQQKPCPPQYPRTWAAMTKKGQS